MIWNTAGKEGKANKRRMVWAKRSLQEKLFRDMSVFLWGFLFFVRMLGLGFPSNFLEIIWCVRVHFQQERGEREREENKQRERECFKELPQISGPCSWPHLARGKKHSDLSALVNFLYFPNCPLLTPNLWFKNCWNMEERNRYSEILSGLLLLWPQHPFVLPLCGQCWLQTQSRTDRGFRISSDQKVSGPRCFDCAIWTEFFFTLLARRYALGILTAWKCPWCVHNTGDRTKKLNLENTSHVPPKKNHGNRTSHNFFVLFYCALTDQIS